MRRLREFSALRDTQQQRALMQRYAGAGLALVGFDDRDAGGIFRVPCGGVTLRVMAGVGEGWDHVSVSVIGLPRTPSWAEMEFVKRMFFRADETAMQLHVPPSDHISNHDYVLHLWRPHDVEIPRPPNWMV